jgi:hypothetical protein
MICDKITPVLTCHNRNSSKEAEAFAQDNLDRHGKTGVICGIIPKVHDCKKNQLETHSICLSDERRFIYLAESFNAFIQSL